MNGIVTRLDVRRADVKRPSDNYTIQIAAEHSRRFWDLFAPKKYYVLTEPLGTNRCSNILESPEYFLVPVREVSRTFYRGPVYNLHVDTDESYTVSGIATHNCIPVFEAAAMGKPVIVPNYSAFPEHFNDWNSYLVDVPNEISVGNMSHISPLYTGDMLWGDPSIPSCRQKMREVFGNQEAAKEKGRLAKEYVKEYLNYEAIGRIMKGRLESIYRGMIGEK